MVFMNFLDIYMRLSRSAAVDERDMSRSSVQYIRGIAVRARIYILRELKILWGDHTTAYWIRSHSTKICLKTTSFSVKRSHSHKKFKPTLAST